MRCVGVVSESIGAMVWGLGGPSIRAKALDGCGRTSSGVNPLTHTDPHMSGLFVLTARMMCPPSLRRPRWRECFNPSWNKIGTCAQCIMCSSGMTAVKGACSRSRVVLPCCATNVWDFIAHFMFADKKLSHSRLDNAQYHLPPTDDQRGILTWKRSTDAIVA